MKDAYIVTIVLLYKIAIVYGTVYAVWHGSNWWVLLLIFAFISIETKDND